MATSSRCASNSRLLLQRTHTRIAPPSRASTSRISLAHSRARSASTFKPSIVASSRTSVGSAPPSKVSKPATPEESDAGLATKVAQQVRHAAPSLTETYVAYGACEALVRECARPADYDVPQSRVKDSILPKNSRNEDLGVGTGWWYTGLGMEPTFSTWAQITLLHMWLLTVRLRAFPREVAPAWHQHLVDHFFHRAEERLVVLHRVSSKMLRQRYLKDIFLQWRGLTAGYDEGIIRGDAVLAAALWRNVCRADASVDARRLAEMVCYVRSVLAYFDSMSDEAFAKGDVVFGDPGGEADVVRLPSRGIGADL